MHISSKIKIWMLWVSILFLFVPISIWAVWIYVFEKQTSSSQTDKVLLFRSYLFELSIGDIYIIIIIACIISLVLALISKRKKSEGQNLINLLIIIISSLLMIMTLFSLM